MLTEAMRRKLEELVAEFTVAELMDLRTFLKMAAEVRGMDNGQLFGLKMVLEDKGNPNRWNLKKLVDMEFEKRRGHSRFNLVPIDPFQWDKTGTNGTTSETVRNQSTRPQPGDE